MLNPLDKQPADVAEPIRKSAMTPVRWQELHDMADRILESDHADLFIALVEALYQHVMTNQKR